MLNTVTSFKLHCILGYYLIPPWQKTLFSATPKDVVRFLVWKDGKGKTMVHFDSRQFLGLQAKQTCNCPTRLSAGTVDSLIGKLRSHAGLAWV